MSDMKYPSIKLTLLVSWLLVCSASVSSAQAWTNLGSSINSFGYGLAVSTGGAVYVGGAFDTADETAASRIAKWDGSAWSALGSGMNNPVSELAVDGAGNLYAGGEFTMADGNAANFVAKWNGSSWSALGSGMNNSVFALAVDGEGNLYAGGWFTTAGGTAANRIAKWDGSAWSALGSGMNNPVDALAVDGAGNLYAGGEFTTAGGGGANRIAKWDGSSWSALGSGMNSAVRALAVDGAGNLYAGGNFSMAGGTAANRVAKWNGSAWTAVGTGMSLGVLVRALAIDARSHIYAGGIFTQAGGQSATNVAEWNGESWLAMGPGLDNMVYALAIKEPGGLLAAGMFGQPGQPSPPYVASWTFADPRCIFLGSNGSSIASGETVSSSTGTDFGLVVVGQSSPHTLSITNFGNTNLVISSVTTTGVGAACFSITGLPTNLPANNCSNFVVTFQPVTEGVHTAAFTMVNSGVVTSFVLNVAGTGAVVNVAPEVPVLLTPTNLPEGNDFSTYGRTLNLRPRLIWSIPTDADEDLLHFKVYYDQADASTLVANSSNSQAGFEFYNGSAWAALPADGVPSTNTGFNVRFEPQSDLTNNTNTNWRIVANDGIVDGDSSTTNRFWVGGRTWTDAALAPGGWIRVAHITELREEANYARACRGLATNAWTDPSLTANATAIRAVHITELREAIAGLTNVTGETLAPWTDDPIVPNVTAIQTNHVLELRQALETVN